LHESYARFLANAGAALFLISMPDLADTDPESGLGPADEIERLLTVYRNGVAELGGDTRGQRLLVVFTKADEWEALRRPDWRPLLEHVRADSFDGLADHRRYRRRLREVSEHLRRFVTDDLKAQGFLNHAAHNFASLDFCVVSSLGSAPAGQHIQTEVAPRRVLDPLLWVLDPKLAGRPPRRAWLRQWLGRRR
jgi:hypothetical protein